MTTQEDLDYDELEIRLLSIKEICKEALSSGRPMLTSEYDLLRLVKNIASSEDETAERISDSNQKSQEFIIISCDASVTEDKTRIGIVIEDLEQQMQYSRPTKSTTRENGLCDAIYGSLTQLFDLKNNPGYTVEVRIDNKEVVDQLYGRRFPLDDKQGKKIANILELVKTLPVPVRVVWRPKNSTESLRLANKLSKWKLPS